MTVYRSNYGDALFGQDTYGLSGSVVDAAASISPSCSVTASAVKVFEGSANVSVSVNVSATLQEIQNASVSITPTCSVSVSADVLTDAVANFTCTSSATCSAIRIRTSAVNIVLQSAIVVVGEEYPEDEGFRPGYGKNTYGTFIYGENRSVDEVSVTIPLTSSVAVAYQRERPFAANITSSCSVVCSATIDTVASANIALSSSVNIEYNRVISFAASDNVTSATTVSARYKWIDVTNPSTTWTDADILERAA